MGTQMSNEEKKNGLVKANTKAYGYSYTSLSDIVDQGYKLPKMKTGTDGNGKDYVYYYDEDLKEWIRGAEVVVPDMKGSNSAQRYGSALSYSRRYSAMLCLGLASRDDEKLETQAPNEDPNKSRTKAEQEPKTQDKSLRTLAIEFRRVVPADVQQKILDDLKLKRPEDLGIVNLERYIEHYAKQTDTGEGNI